MRSKLLFCASCVLAGQALAQQQPAAVQVNPTPGCTATPPQLEANKKVAMDFFRPTVDRVALADPSYKQHNPQFVQRAQQNKVTDYEEFKSAFSAQGRGPAGARGGTAGGNAQPPAGNPYEIVTAECDIVTIVHKNYRPDPTSEGKFYEAFTFDTFRVKDGKLVEHWDGATLNPPATQGGGGAQGRGGTEPSPPNTPGRSNP